MVRRKDIIIKRQEFIISDLSNAVIEKEYLASTGHPNRNIPLHGIIRWWRPQKHIDLKLKDDEFPSTVTAGDLGKYHAVAFNSTEVIAEFLGKVRKAFQDYAEAHDQAPLKIYLNSYFSHEDALLNGFDLERLAK